MRQFARPNTTFAQQELQRELHAIQALTCSLRTPQLMQARAQPVMQVLTAKDQAPCSPADQATCPLGAPLPAAPLPKANMLVATALAPLAPQLETLTGVWLVISKPEPVSQATTALVV